METGENKKIIRVALIDDHKIILDGIISLLEHEENILLDFTTTNYNDFLNALKQGDFDVAMVDLSMPEVNGSQLTKMIKKKFPNVHVLVLTMHSEIQKIKEAIEAGADGYVLKNTDRDELVRAITNVSKGNPFYSMDVAQKMMTASYQSANISKNTVKLTPRERSILILIAKEYTTVDMANTLNLSPNTIDTHRKNLHVKFGVNSLVGLIKQGVKHGYITLD